MSADQFRVVFGTGGNTRYVQYSTLTLARDAAAEAIRIGPVSQVALEKLEDGKWVLVRSGKQRG